MSFSVGIIGLPNAGKSTLFKALTKLDVRIEPRPFTTIEPNVGTVPVPDEKLEKLSNMLHPDKTTPTTIEFWDIAGLIKDAHKGEGLGNTFLSQIRNCDILVEVVRAFSGDNISHVEGNIDPHRDREIIDTELLMKDLETITNSLERTTHADPKEKITLLTKIKDALEQGVTVRDLALSEEETEMIKEFNLLTGKPIIYLLNGEDESELAIDLKLEEEIDELSLNDLKELGVKSELSTLIHACYAKLDLITFYTIRGGKEVRAWSLKKGSTAPEAGGEVGRAGQLGDSNPKSRAERGARVRLSVRA